MAQSFRTAEEAGALSKLNSEVTHRVLVTGAAGNIGSYFAENSHQKYTLRLMVRAGDDSAKIKAFGEIVEADLGDLEGLTEACRGMDTVLHLAADASPNATWDSLLPNNIVGTYNIFLAAKAAGCKRVIYASSIHAVSGYPADYQVHTTDPVNPGDLYGVTKCFGEALARYMAEKENLPAICLRIGAFQSLDDARQEESINMLDAFISQRDLNQLIHRCIDTEELRFAILHGLSNNRFKRLDITDARELVGYEPIDDLTMENPKLRQLQLGETVQEHNVKDEREESAVRETVQALRPKGDRSAPDTRPSRGKKSEAKGRKGRRDEPPHDRPRSKARSARRR